MKHFMNFDMGAPNVVTIPVDREVVGQFQTLAEGALAPDEYAVISPPWHSDIKWISPNNATSFAAFEAAFDQLGIADHVAQYLDLEERPRLYNGFLLVRTTCSDTNFHVDWADAGNEAFTFITPLDERAQGFGLVYEKVNGSIGEYDYRPGEGILFGDKFVHSTKPGQSERPVALLCFQFGTDKMKHWDKIMETAGYQSLYIQQPDGRFARRTKGLLGTKWKVLRRP